MPRKKLVLGAVCGLLALGVGGYWLSVRAAAPRSSLANPPVALVRPPSATLPDPALQSERAEQTRQSDSTKPEQAAGGVDAPVNDRQQSVAAERDSKRPLSAEEPLGNGTASSAGPTRGHGPSVIQGARGDHAAHSVAMRNAGPIHRDVVAGSADAQQGRGVREAGPAQPQTPFLSDTPVGRLCDEYDQARTAYGGTLPRDAAREWRLRLVEAAEANPDDRCAPTAYMRAAKLAESLNEDLATQEELFRACAEHPLASTSDRVLTLVAASFCAEARGDTVQVFNDLNVIARQIEAATDEEREVNRRAYELIPLRKAQALQDRRIRKLPPPPELPPPDTGKSESDLYREALEWHREGRAQSLELEEPGLLYSLARALAAEGRNEEAAAAIREAADHPQSVWPRSMAAKIEAETLYPQHDRAYVEYLEAAEAALPRDERWRELSATIAVWHLFHGEKAKWVARMEPLVNSADPEDQAWIRRNPVNYAGILDDLADYYVRGESRELFVPTEPVDLEKACEYYERLLNECADVVDRDDVLRMIDDVHRRMALAQENEESDESGE